MAVNNELGTIQPIQAVAEYLQNNNDIFFHVDAVQALGKQDIDLKKLHVDSMSFSAHKLYGPKGVGALYLRDKESIEPLIHGGGQENGVRAGTENVIGINGFCKAIALVLEEKQRDLEHMLKQKTLFVNLIKKHFPLASFNGSTCEKFSQNNIVSVTIPNSNRVNILEQLDLHYGIKISKGSACTNNTQGKFSHVFYY